MVKSMKGNKKTVPELRFPGFNDPWEQRKLSELTERVVRKNKNNESDLPLTIASQFGLIDQRDFFNKVVAAKDMSNYYLLEKGEFAYNKSYSNGYDYGSIKRLNAYEKGCLSTLYICFRLISSEVDSDYLECYFDTLNWYDDVAQICSEGARNHGLLNVDTKAFFDVVTIMMPPSKEEQKKISAVLNELDEAITLHQRKCDELKNYKKGLLQQMFPLPGESIPRIRFPGFNDPWEQRKFFDVVEIGSGMDYKHLGEGGIPVYGTGGYMLSVDAALSEDKDAIGIGRKGTIDKPYILRAPFWTVDTLFYCIPKEKYDLDFTNCLFQNVDWKKKDESTGVPSLSKVIINNVETTVPSFDEQKKIGEYFKSLDNLITLHQRKYDEMTNYKKGLLQKMFV